MCGRSVVTPSTPATEIVPVNRGGRPPFNKKLMLVSICAELEKGKSLVEIGQMEGFPARRTIHEWCENYPEVSAQIQRALDIGCDAMADEALRIADNSALDVGPDGKVNSEVVARSKLRVDTRLRLLACRSKRYNPHGEKGGTVVNVGVQVNAMTDEARERIREKKQRAIAFERAAKA